MTTLLIFLGLIGAPPDTVSLFRAERAFAARSLSHGIDSSFLYALAPDAVLFRAGPVNGPKWIREHPGKPSSRLSWGPSAGAVSAAGDLGITTGPWTFTDASKPDAPAHYGHFVSVWKRQDNGEWKVAVDIGIAHPQQSPDAVRGRFDQRHWGSPPSGPAGTPAITAVLNAEQELLLAIDRAGTRAPLLRRMAPDAVLYRNGEPPITDNDKIKRSIETAMPPFAWKSSKAEVAASGDVAYSYGTYVMGSEKGNYLRIWRLSPRGEWLILVDLTDPDA